MDVPAGLRQRVRAAQLGVGLLEPPGEQQDVAAPELQQELQQEFQKRLLPILEAISKEKGIQVLFSAGDAGVIWIEQGIDLTLEAVKRMDARATAK